MAGLVLPPKVHSVGVSLHPAFALRSGAPQFLPLIQTATARAARRATLASGPARDFDIRVGASYDEAVAAWSAAKTVAIDVETPRGAPTTITIVSVAVSDRLAYVWPWTQETRLVVEGLLADPAKVKVGHNFAYDTKAFHAYGPEVGWPVADTIQAAALLWPPFAEAKDRPWLRLHWCAARVMDGLPYWKEPGTGEAKALYRVMFPHAPEWQFPYLYCGLDTLMTWRLWAAERELLVREGMLPLFEDIVAPAAQVLIRMEERGVPLDEDRRKALRKETEKFVAERSDAVQKAADEAHTRRILRVQGQVAVLEVDALEAARLPSELAACPDHADYAGATKRAKCSACSALYTQTAEVRAKVRRIRKIAAEGRALLKRLGKGFNVDSNDSWRTLLFDPEVGLGLKPTAYTTKTKQPQVDDDAIETFAAKHPEIDLLRWRVDIQHATRRLSNVLGVEADYEGRVHFAYSMHRTETGRIASGLDDAEPRKMRLSPGNAQNIPDRDRVIYRPGRPGYVFVSADWSQIEARVVAWLAEDATMLKALAAGLDLHALLAAKAFGIEQSATRTVYPIVGHPESARDLAKRVRHGKNYGMGPVKGAKVLGVTTAEAARLWRLDDEMWPAVPVWQRQVIARVERDGCLRNCFGRLLRFHRFRKDPATGARRLLDREEALAFLPQSTVGDMCKAVLPELDRIGALTPTVLVTTTHDSFLFEAHGDDAAMVVDETRRIMQREWKELGWFDGFGYFSCPADFSVGRNWGKYHWHQPSGPKACSTPCPVPENLDGLMKWEGSAAPLVA